jgi:hypothetical protein
MKTLKYLLLLAFPIVFIVGCSEDLYDEINKDRNNATVTSANIMISDAMVNTAWNAGADLAWYSTIFCEHNAGIWSQSYQADTRISQEAASTMNNAWNSQYSTMLTCKSVLDLCKPGGAEADNYITRGIALVLTAYNLALTTDGWGEVPFEEACQGAVNMKPKFELQSDIYPKIQVLLDSAILNFNKTTLAPLGNRDLIYGAINGSVSNATLNANWKRAAYSLKARYALRLSNIHPTTAYDDALTYLSNGFTSAAQQFMFSRYGSAANNQNPWWQFFNDRYYFAPSVHLDTALSNRADPRQARYIVFGPPAPNGTAVQTQNDYGVSGITYPNGATVATPLMTYHELLFIKAECEFKTGVAAATWQATLQAAITANFVFQGLTAAQATTYFNNAVLHRLYAGNELHEILMQKWLAFFEHEAIEAYNDVRRTGIPAMTNPLNATIGFPWRYAWATSEVTSNGANIPTGMNIYTSKLWWAGGTELTIP